MNIPVWMLVEAGVAESRLILQKRDLKPTEINGFSAFIPGDFG